MKFNGFTPDLDPSVPGCVVACTNVIPYEYGMKGAPQFTVFSGNLGATAWAGGGGVLNGATATLLSGIQRIFASSATKLYEYTAGAWTDRGRAAPAYVPSAWDFAQFGDATLVASLGNLLQRASGLGSAIPPDGKNDFTNSATAAANKATPTPCGTPPAPTASANKLSSMPRAAPT